jgi:hypothetical protein
VQIGIPHNISFDDENLKIISVENFDLTYEEIKMSNGLMLSECREGKIHSENSSH